MASNLRAKLQQLSSAPTAPPKPKVSLADMTYVEHAHVADERLYDLSADALARMGFEGEWPGIERALFLDTETTGLSRGAGTIAFMIGLGYVRDGAFIIQQYMVGDYPDEPKMMQSLAALLPDFDVLVSFNGKNFDAPLLESRAVMCRMKPPFSNLRHLDLMYPSRRLWKNRIGSCRLVALEDQILGSGRVDDLPGSEAPKRFFSYLETGDLSLLSAVLHHNMLDIASLGSLLIVLNESYANPLALPELPDLYSMGRAMERIGETELARRCYEKAAIPKAALNLRQLRDDQFGGKANWSLAAMHKRAGDFETAVAIWEQMARRNQLGTLPHLELAKHYEHRAKRLEKALASARSALELEHNGADRSLIVHRITRISAKLSMQKEKDTWAFFQE